MTAPTPQADVPLLPCPFCGTEPNGIFGPHPDVGTYWVECHGSADEATFCGDWHYIPDLPDGHSVPEGREATRAAWNRRAALSSAAPQADAEPHVDGWPLYSGLTGSAPQALPEHQRSAPARIWLHDGADESTEPFPSTPMGEDVVTWSADNATGRGVPYVRADLAYTLQDLIDHGDARAQAAIRQCHPFVPAGDAATDKDSLTVGCVQADGPALPAPFWHAIVSEQHPIINKAVRREDVADEYAEQCRDQGRPGVEVVRLYSESQVLALLAAPPATQAPADPGTDAPIARLRFDARGSAVEVVTTYSPGLPEGEHDVWCTPVAQALAQPLSEERIAEACGWKAGMGCKPLSSELRIARGVERACAEAWGVKLAGTPGGDDGK